MNVFRIFVQNMLIAVIIMAIACMAIGCRGSREEEGDTDGIEVEGSFSSGPCDSECVAKIRAARAKLLAVEENEVSYVRDRYNTEYATSSFWKRVIPKCRDHRELIEEMTRRTLYPEAFLGGFAIVEGMCKSVVVSGDGGHGLFQITKPDKHHLRAAARALGVKLQDFTYQTDGRHNAMLGVVMLDDCERKFGSRGPGILCYNRGAGGVSKDMRKAGLSPPGMFQISDFRGTIPAKAGKGGQPKIYVDRILAAAVAYERVVMRGEALAPIDVLEHADIPGADPKRDGE